TTYDIWAAVHAERRALATDLNDLSPEKWTTPSLCADWDVHDVLAHQLETAKETRRRFLLRFAAAGFDFDRYNQRGVRAERRADPAETLAAFRAVSASTATPPAPLASRLVEVFVHGEDIRRPLGPAGNYPVEGVALAIRHQAGVGAGLGGAKQLVQGLRVRATDTDLDLGGGPVVEGPVISVLLALCGRSVALGELNGPGVETLAGRI
ncbi:MAG TPA: maleylpyruvate isomerase family mycothiol-dependent enzyme, partial [Nocardioides sp.]|nr:maleylpyruvate isomerase family mycothiol-dependent enzyme [Nocardioides sp.]